MTLKSNAMQWGSVARFFHWAVVLLILVEGTLGLTMVGLPKTPGAFVYYDLHKSIGLTIFALAVLRLAWRAFDPHPRPVPTMPAWQALGARIGHVLLYVLLFLVPASGWWFDSVEGLRPLYWFGLFQVPHLVAPDAGLKHFAHESHEILFWALVVVAAGHAMAALVHHFIEKDATLTRMLPSRGRALLGAAIGLLILAMIVLPPMLAAPDAKRGAPEATASAAAEAPGAAAAVAPATTAPASADAALARAWAVDPAQSTLGFKGTFQDSGFEGAFKRFDAAIHYDDANLAGSKFDVTIDLASADTGNSDRDDSLHGADFFDVAKTPSAHFVTVSFAKAADGSIEAHGQLTIRDKTAPVVLKVAFAATGDSATLDVDTVLKRADYGLGNGSDWDDIGADVPVHGHLVLSGK